MNIAPKQNGIVTMAGRKNNHGPDYVASCSHHGSISPSAVKHTLQIRLLGF